VANPDRPVPLCLRCPDATLRALDRTQEVAFFECPSCGRHFAQKESGALTYRWRHPVSLPLYCVLFSENAVADAPRVATHLADTQSSAELEAMTREIELELEQPTQEVRHILDNPQSEETCRKFLLAVAKIWRQRLAASNS
jgi:plasmid stabilization system protein ParE